MHVVLLTLGVVLALPVLLLAGMVLGPAALVMLFIVVCALPVVWVVRQVSGRAR